MIVDDLDRMCVPVLPDKAKTPMIVDTDAVLAHAIAVQSLQPVSWRRCQVPQFRRACQLPQFPPRHLLNRSKAPYGMATVQPFGLGATVWAPRNDRITISNLYRTSFNVNR
jgi:hypothetical protein